MRFSYATWICFAGVMLLPASGQQQNLPKPAGLPFEQRMSGDMVIAAAAPLRDEIQKITAVIYSGRNNIGYGVVMTPDGYVMAKASELEGKPDLTVRIDRTKYDRVEVVAKDAKWDVALLKVDGKDLATPKWSEGSNPGLGSIVVSNGATTRQERKVKIGVVSAMSRGVRKEGIPALGIEFKGMEDLTVKKVVEKSGAATAGIREGDVIRSIGEVANLKSLRDLEPLLNKVKPGDEVDVTLVREGKEVKLRCRISSRSELFGEKQVRTRNDEMSGEFSSRRSEFPKVLQHDSLLHPQEIGGPLLLLDGTVVGMNIARVNRSETYALPGDEVRKLFTELKGGKPAGP